MRQVAQSILQIRTALAEKVTRPGRLARRGAADVIVLALVLAAAAGAAWLLRDPAPVILDRRGSLTAAYEETLEVADSHYVQVVRLRSSSGLTVSMTTKRHVADADVVRPLVAMVMARITGTTD